MKKHDIFPLIWKSKFSISKETVDQVLKEIDNEIHYLSTVASPNSSTRALKGILKTIEDLKIHKKNILNKYKRWEKTYDEKRFPRAVREVEAEGVLGTETTKEEDCSEKAFGMGEQRTVYASRDKSQIQKGRFSDYIDRKKEEYGSKFDDSDLADKFIPYYESQQTIKVKSSGETKYGKVGITTGWRPVFILVHPGASGSGFTLSNSDEILWEKSQIDFSSKRDLLKELYLKAFGTSIGLDPMEIEKMDEKELDEKIESLKAVYKNGR